MEPGWEALGAKLAMGSGAGNGAGVQSTYVDNNGQRVAIMRDGSTQVLGQSAPTQQIIGVRQPDGSIQYQAVTRNVATPFATPVGTGGQPAPPAQSGPLPTSTAPQFGTAGQGANKFTMQIDGVSPDLQNRIAQQASAMLAAGVPMDQVDAWALSMLPGSAPVAGNGGGVLTAAPEPDGPADNWQSMSTTEIQAYGWPAGTVAFRNAKNGDVKFGPSTVQPGKPNAQNQAKKQKAEEAKQDTITTYDDGIAMIRRLMNDPKFSTLGTAMGDLQANIPYMRNDAKDARAALDNIKSRIVIDTLGKLKALSATGASGFGALSNQEATILQNSMASLDTDQSNAALKQSLTDIVNIMERTRNRLAGTEVSIEGADSGGAVEVTTQAEFDALPSGALFIEDGVQYRKP